MKDLNFLTFNTIRDDIGVLDQDQLTSAMHATCATRFRVSHQLLCAGYRVAEKLSCCLGVVLGDVIVSCD